MEGGKSTVRKRGSSELIGKFTAYECSYCSVILTEYEDLDVHSKNCPSPSCSMICLTCGEKFPSKPEMRQHLKFMHSHKTFGCKFCDMMFLSSSGLLSHTKAKHKPDPKTLCQICGQAFHNKANLEGHMNMHLGLKPFKCKKCGKSYGHSKSLMTHEKTCSKSISLRGTKPALSPKEPLKIDPEMHPSRVCDSSNLTTSRHRAVKREPTARRGNTGSIDSMNSNQFLFNETYQLFDSSKKTCSERSGLQIMQNATQSFPFSDSYQSLQSEDLPSISSAPNVDGGLGNIVYAQTNNEFVMPHVTYETFPSGMLPDNR